MTRLDLNINCAPLNARDAGPLVELIEANPFARYEWMTVDLDKHGADEPYRRDALLKRLKRAQWNCLLYSHGDTVVELGLTQRRRGTNIALTVNDRSLMKEWQRFVAYGEALMRTLPKVSSAHIEDADADVPGLYQALDLEAPPGCFSGYLRWRHYLGPDYFGLFLSADDLLAAPAHQVRQLDDGVVAMTSYASPLEWNGAEARDRLRKLTDYLNAKDVFLPP